MSEQEIDNLRFVAKQKHAKLVESEKKDQLSVLDNEQKAHTHYERVLVSYDDLLERYHTLSSVMQSQQKNQVMVVRTPGLEQCAKVLKYMQNQQLKHGKFIAEHTNPVRRFDYTTVPMKRILVSFLQECIDMFYKPEWFGGYKIYIEAYLSDRKIQSQQKKTKSKKQNNSTQKKAKVEQE